MFSHIMVGANDIEESKKFYDALQDTLGHKPGAMDEKGRVFYPSETGFFGITLPLDGEAATHANGGTIGFSAPNTEAIDAWHAAGIANGGTTCENPPGIREGRVGEIYLAYLRDPAGNKICALHRMK
ncbi:MAG: VOC family protein [Gammaproteobacteria bacterium]|jgi:catechol 2,3-dioxygenase-like lactoylglutathione lyase family enzyme|nr:VOC family protein [Gammaproteobacteria bacterium]MBT3858994.1 VOC family protein [Gammaproteobacteria bacterium]MBT3988054.1 VOC family protein [Gammaproteobacteria bacterium]MBT4256116.1 VOC family protein [Gammaproteobacteria bacterium]MBT4583441.1 VOC family protein [Gammaproteobacteria bacterium]